MSSGVLLSFGTHTNVIGMDFFGIEFLDLIHEVLIREYVRFVLRHLM